MVTVDVARHHLGVQNEWRSTRGRESGIRWSSDRRSDRRYRRWNVTARRRRGLPDLVRGTALVHRRRCGKTNCRCASGEKLHESTLLSYKQGGKTKHLRLPASQVEPVRQATERFRAAAAALRAEGDAGLAEVIAAWSIR
jgi:hypothetical protein